MRSSLRLLSLSLAGVLALGSPALAGETCPYSGGQPKPASDTRTAPVKNLVETAQAAGSFSTLLEAAEAAGLVDVLAGQGPLTVFAPTDEAFAKVPAKALEALLADKAALTEVLTYHVVPGRVLAADAVKLDWAPTVSGSALRVEAQDDGVLIDGARVLSTDIQASNGVIHVIDSVMMPRKDLVATAVSAGSFTTLVTAVKAAGLVETLAEGGPFTVFAPADAAFAKVPEATLKGLLADKAALASVLTYHVVPGRILAKAIAEGSTRVKTVQGQELSIVRAKDGTITVDGARVVTTDVLAGNGVIHVIDAVVLPRQGSM
ncbi:MAG: fasciclin domain-containing protein [Planctomycetota bacterium]